MFHAHSRVTAALRIRTFARNFACLDQSVNVTARALGPTWACIGTYSERRQLRAFAEGEFS
jgi:hypothetical protein